MAAPVSDSSLELPAGSSPELEQKAGSACSCLYGKGDWFCPVQLFFPSQTWPRWTPSHARLVTGGRAQENLTLCPAELLEPLMVRAGQVEGRLV